MHRTEWLLFLALAVGLATTSSIHAGAAVDFDAEAKQAAKEEAEQKAERAMGVTGKYQRTFYGTFQKVAENNSEQLSTEVVGTFATNEFDRKPGRTYLVKVENGNKAVLDTLKRYDGKTTEITGKLRVIGPDGEGKYLIVSTVVEVAPTRPAVERRKMGGL